MFVRTAGCDYRCSWCDSAFTWDGSAKEDIKLMTAEEIYNQLKKSAVTVLITLRYLEVTQRLIKGIQDLVDLFEENRYTLL